MSKNGLVLEGGAMRGLFTEGILDVFLENDITFDGAVGVSAGACFGCNYKSKQIGRALRYNKRFCKDPRYCGFLSLLITGDLLNAKFCYNTVPFKYDVWDFRTFQKNPMEFYSVATDAYTGEASYHKCTNGMRDDIEYFRASASLPIVSRVVKIGDERLVDGGVADSIPIRFFQNIGYDKNVIILTQPIDYRKEKNKMLPLAKIRHHKYPKLIEAIANRHIYYNETLDYIKELEAKGEVLVIRPTRSLPSNTKDPNELDATYQLGREIGFEYLDRVKDYLNS